MVQSCHAHASGTTDYGLYWSPYTGSVSFTQILIVACTFSGLAALRPELGLHNCSFVQVGRGCCSFMWTLEHFCLHSSFVFPLCLFVCVSLSLSLSLSLRSLPSSLSPEPEAKAWIMGVIPGSQQYVKQLPKATRNSPKGYCCTYFRGPGRSQARRCERDGRRKPSSTKKHAHAKQVNVPACMYHRYMQIL